MYAVRLSIYLVFCIIHTSKYSATLTQRHISSAPPWPTAKIIYLHVYNAVYRYCRNPCWWGLTTVIDKFGDWLLRRKQMSNTLDPRPLTWAQQPFATLSSCRLSQKRDLNNCNWTFDLHKRHFHLIYDWFFNCLRTYNWLRDSALRILIKISIRKVVLFYSAILKLLGFKYLQNYQRDFIILIALWLMLNYLRE